MKLAEALIARADLQNKVLQIKTRMIQNIKVEEDEEPVEEIDKLFRQYDALMAELETIIVRINKTNEAMALDSGTLAGAIAKRDCLKAKITTYRELIEKASVLRERGYTRDEEIKYVRCVDILELRKQTDDLAKQYRELDTKMQGLNWTVDLL
jgi:hypothetical protein